MPITCLALNGEASLPYADTSEDFMIELVKVTDSWELYSPTAQGDVPLSRSKEGERMRMSLQNKKLVRAVTKEDEEETRGKLAAQANTVSSRCKSSQARPSQVEEAPVEEKDMDSELRSAISQVVCDDPRIGRVWIAQLTICAALEAGTCGPWTVDCLWEGISAIARQQLELGKEEPGIAPMHCGLSTEHEREVISEEYDDSDLIGNYQETLKQIEEIGKRRLEIARSVKNGV